MAQGQFTREQTGNPLAVSDLGTAPKTRAGLSGVRTGQGQVDTSSTLTDSVDTLLDGAASLRQRTQNEDFIRGQAAAMAGETEAELRARGGSRHEMAGMVEIEVGNMMSAWHQQQIQDAKVNWSETDPAEYQKHLAAQSADLIEQVGGDAFAKSTLTGLLGRSVGQLAQAQQISHQGFVENGIATEYGAGLSIAASHGVAVTRGTSTTPVANAGFRDLAASVVDATIHHESGGDVNAQNPMPGQTAGGAAGFIDSTWINMIRTHRPDLAAGKTSAEIVAMKTGAGSGPLSREMAIAYGAENAASLSAAGLPVTKGTIRLAHFAGGPGAKRLLRADPSAPVREHITAAAYKANPHIQGKTVQWVIDWAAKQAGSAQETTMRQRVLTNPGITPERHRQEVLGAMLDGFRNDDPTLFETAGGVETLRELGASNAQIRSIMKGYEAYKDRELSAYSMEYERGADEIISLADEGELSEDEVYERLMEFQTAHPRTDVEARRLYNEVAKELRANEVDVGWATPDGMKFLLDITDRAEKASDTDELRDIMSELVDEGIANGISPEDTATQTAGLAKAYASVQDAKATEVARRARAAESVRATEMEALRALSTGTLDDASPKVQAAGIKQLQARIGEEVRADVDSGAVPVAQAAAAAAQRYTQELVASNAVDPTLANEMAASVVDTRGWGVDGDLPQEAITAYATYLEFVKGERATDAYMNRMFADKPEALAFFRSAEAMDVGSSDTTTALRTAARLRDEPARLDAVIARMETLNSSSFMEDAVEEFTRQSGLMGNWVQRRLGRLTTSAQQDADADTLATDTKLRSYLDSATRAVVAQVPGITPEAARKHAVGQALNAGAAVMGNFIVAPTGTTVYELAGISKDEGPDAINTAVQDAILDNLDQLPESARNSIVFAMRQGPQSLMTRSSPGSEFFGIAAGDEMSRKDITSADWDIHTINTDGDIQFFVTPNKATIDNWSKILLGSGNQLDVAAMSQPIQFSLSEAGRAWNMRENAPSAADDLTNSFVDSLRSFGAALADPEEPAPLPQLGVSPQDLLN